MYVYKLYTMYKLSYNVYSTQQTEYTAHSELNWRNLEKAVWVENTTHQENIVPKYCATMIHGTVEDTIVVPIRY